MERIEPTTVLPWVLAGLLFFIMIFVVVGNNAKKEDLAAAEVARERVAATQNAALIVAERTATSQNAGKTPNPAAVTPAANTVKEKIATVAGLEGDVLRLRKDPTTAAPILKNLKEGEKVKVLDGPKLSDGLEWYQVDYNGQAGWVVKKYLAFT